MSQSLFRVAPGAKLSVLPVVLALLAAFPAVVFAQSVLPEVHVAAGAEEPALTQPGIAGARQEINTTAGAVDVIDAQVFRSGRVSTLTDALGYSAGVFVQPRFGSEESRISIRGSGLQRTFHLRGVKLLQDGVPINLADGSGDFQAIEPLAARYIEVYRGANALQYGSATLGGAINYVTPTGYDADPLLVRAELGSFGYQRTQIASGGASGVVDGFATASTFRQDGFRDHARQDAHRLIGNAGWRLSEDVETRFFIGYAKSDSELPGNLTKAQLRRDPELANAGNVSGDQKRDIELARIANRTVFRVGGTRFELFSYYSDKQLFHPIFQVLDQDNRDYGLHGRMVSEHMLGAMPNRVVAGVAPARGFTRDERWVNVGGRRGARTNKLDQDAKSVEAYVEDQLTFTPGWTLTLGTQYTHTTRKNSDRCYNGSAIGCASTFGPFGNVNADESFDVSYTGWSPKLGLRHDWSEAVQFFANVARSFEPPSFGELTGGLNPVILKAQRGTTFEIGSRGTLPGLAWDVAVYHARLRNEMLQTNVQLAGNSNNPVAPVTVNVPRTVHQGLELATSGTFAGNADWRQALLVQRFRFDDDATFGNKTLPGVPKSLLRGEVGYRFAAPGGPLRVAVNVEWSPQSYPVDMRNTLSADRYAIWGLKLRQELGRQWSWFVDARNLADQKYAATTGVMRDAGGVDQAQFLPGDGRSVFAGVEWKL